MMNKAFVGILLLLTSFFTFAEVGTIYGPTTAEETIWSIARKVHPDAKIPVSQTVAALYQANPQAFMNKNINRLMKDVYLTVPTLETIQAAELATIQQKPVEKPKAKKVKAAEKPVEPPVVKIEPPKPEPVVVAPQPTTTPVTTEQPLQSVEVAPTITTTALPEEPVFTPIIPTVEATPETTTHLFGFSLPVFKPFEWILISLLSFLSLLVIWVLFSLNRTYKYLLAQKTVSPIIVPEQELPIKKVLTEAKANQTKTETNFLDLDMTDDISTKLDLARAYIEMHEHEPAKRILQQAIKQGKPHEQQEAHKLLNLINTAQ